MSFTFKETEQKIKDYYSRLKLISYLELQIRTLLERQSEWEEHYNIKGVVLDYSFPAVKYDNVSISGNIKTSPQERAVEKFYSDYEKIKIDIFEAEEKIRILKSENSEIEFALKNVKQEYIDILESFYKYNKGVLWISIYCNMDKATIYRKKHKAVKEVIRWLNFYN